MISSNPNQLHIYDPSTNADVTVPLTSSPVSLSVGPDGLHAAVASTTSVDYVNLQSETIEHSYSLPVSAGSSGPVSAGKFVLGTTYFYILPNNFFAPATSVNLSTGAATTINGIYGGGSRYNSTINAVYSLQSGGLIRYDASTGPLTAVDQKYLTTCYDSNSLWLSPDGSRIYTSCGTVFNASADTTKDRQYKSALNGVGSIQALSESAALHRIAAVPQPSTLFSSIQQSDNEVRLFSSDYLNQVGRFTLYPFTVGSSVYAAHGRYVFFNQAGTSLYVLSQADSSSGLLEDFSLQKIALAASASCTVTLSQAAPIVLSTGMTGSVDVTASTDCIFEAQSSVPWIKLLSGYYGSGNTQLTYLVRPNDTAVSRTGTISVGGRTLTLTQDAAAPVAALNPLSYKVAAADYSKSLDRLVLASGNSNELHLYDPVSGLDHSIALLVPPLSVSVRPDGDYAAVGHDGWVSYVNLRSQAVEQTIPIGARVQNIILASNGYVYAFPDQALPGSLYFLRIGDAGWTSTPTLYYGGVPRLHQSGKYIYVGNDFLPKLDITGGDPKAVGMAGNFGGCGNVWLTEDGQKLIDSCGAVYRTTESIDDLSANGSLYGAKQIEWAAHSIQQHEIAVITYYLPEGYAVDDTRLQLYGDDALQFVGQNTLPQFSIGSASVAGHGRFLFWNTAESKIMIVEQADSASGLISDYAVYTLNAGSGPVNCSYQLSAAQISVGAAGDYSKSINVTTQDNCGWSATSGSSWVNISSISTGAGSGTVGLLVDPNYTNIPRSGTVIIAGKTVSVLQDASDSCTYTLLPQAVSVPPASGNGSFTITAGSMCAWNLISNEPWLTITSEANGYGSATVTYNVAPNSYAAARTATILVGGKLFTVTQAGTAVSVAPGLRFVLATPCRVVDTRLAAGAFGAPYLSGQTSRDFVLPSGPCAIPATALAYSLNVTAVPHGPLRYVTVWPTSGTRPAVSTLNSYDGRVRANAAIIPAGQGGGISVFATDDTDVILDINGYFVQDSSALVYSPLRPCRAVDTRVGLSDLGGPALRSGTYRTLPLLTSACFLGVNAQAYFLNYTVVPKGPLRYLTTWPTGEARPDVSTLNSSTGAVTANAAIVSAGRQGSIDVYVSDDTDLIVDVIGFFSQSGASALSFYPVTPCRAFDTRTTGSGQPYSGELDINVQGSTCNLPAAAQAYALNATVVPSAHLGYLTLWPAGAKQPLVSALNSQDGAITANMAIVTAQGGSISSFVSDATHLILDVTGYFAP